jgi:glutaredoxin/glutathione-dependent peroxiredoxin
MGAQVDDRASKARIPHLRHRHQQLACKRTYLVLRCLRHVLPPFTRSRDAQANTPIISLSLPRAQKKSGGAQEAARRLPRVGACDIAVASRAAVGLPVPARGVNHALTNTEDPMTINVGDKLPSVTLRQVTPEGPKEVSTDDFFRGKRIVLFAVPGAFTPACSQRHLPGFVDRAAEIRAKGIDEIACVSVNDAAVMGAWGRNQRVDGKVTMLADGSGDFAKSLGLELDLSKGGLGIRSKRYSMLVDNGVVKALNVEQQPGQVEASSAEAMLKALV